MKIKELLADPKVWLQGANRETVTSREGTTIRYCIIGAITECYPTFDDQISAVAKIASAINRRYNDDPLIAQWNDDPSRTHAEVLAILEEADV